MPNHGSDSGASPEIEPILREISRRDFLETLTKSALYTSALVSVGSTALLATPAHAKESASPYPHLTEADVEFFTAIFPAVIPQKEALGKEGIYLEALNNILAPLAVDSKARIRMLFDAITAAENRQAFTQSDKNWSEFSVQEIDEILESWRASDDSLFTLAYGVSTRFAFMAWYFIPDNQAITGYPGPPKKVVAAS